MLTRAIWRKAFVRRMLAERAEQARIKAQAENDERMRAKWGSRSQVGGKRVIVITPAKHKQGTKPASCARCDAPVQPGFCYTGKVLDCYIRINVEKSKVNRTTMELEQWTERIPVPSYIKGFICDACAGEYRHHVDERTGSSKPIIVLDPLPTARPRDEREGMRTNKILNTRRVQ